MNTALAAEPCGDNKHRNPVTGECTCPDENHHVMPDGTCMHDADMPSGRSAYAAAATCGEMCAGCTDQCAACTAEMCGDCGGCEHGREMARRAGAALAVLQITMPGIYLLEFGFNPLQKRGPDGRWIKMGGAGSAGGKRIRASRASAPAGLQTTRNDNGTTTYEVAGRRRNWTTAEADELADALDAVAAGGSVPPPIPGRTVSSGGQRRTVEQVQPFRNSSGGVTLTVGRDTADGEPGDVDMTTAEARGLAQVLRETAEQERTDRAARKALPNPDRDAATREAERKERRREAARKRREAAKEEALKRAMEDTPAPVGPAGTKLEVLERNARIMFGDDESKWPAHAKRDVANLRAARDREQDAARRQEAAAARERQAAANKEATEAARARVIARGQEKAAAREKPKPIKQGDTVPLAGGETGKVVGEPHRVAGREGLYVTARPDGGGPLKIVAVDAIRRRQAAAGEQAAPRPTPSRAQRGAYNTVP